MSAQIQYYEADAIGLVPASIFVLLMLVLAFIGVVAHAAAL